MQIRTYQNVMLLDHVTGSGAHAKQMAEVARKWVSETLRKYPRVAVINDGEQFRSPGEDFLGTWASWVQEHRDRPVVIVCSTSKGWVRAVAKTVSVLARVDFEVLKSYAEAAAYLTREGFPDVTDVPWETVLLLDVEMR